MTPILVPHSTTADGWQPGCLSQLVVAGPAEAVAGPSDGRWDKCRDVNQLRAMFQRNLRGRSVRG